MNKKIKIGDLVRFREYTGYVAEKTKKGSLILNNGSEVMVEAELVVLDCRFKKTRSGLVYNVTVDNKVYNIAEPLVSFSGTRDMFKPFSLGTPKPFRNLPTPVKNIIVNIISTQVSK